MMSRLVLVQALNKWCKDPAFKGQLAFSCKAERPRKVATLVIIYVKMKARNVTPNVSNLIESNKKKVKKK